MEFLRSRYGSISGFSRFVYYQAGLLGPTSRELRDVRFADVNRLVFVCRGNVCRSPFCEYVARELDFAAVSYGLDCKVANGAHKLISRIAGGYGINLDDHRSKDISLYSPDRGDLVVVSEPSQVELIQPFLGVAQLTLLGLWTSPSRLYIHDPYCTGKDYCEYCTALMTTGVRRLIQNARRARSRTGRPELDDSMV